MIEEPDDEIADLLAALEAMNVSTPIVSRTSNLWQYSQTEIKCLGCDRTYTGTMQHMENSPYLNSTVLWCPNCIKEKEVDWWLGCLRMEGVKEIV